jgi:hypothetical protein
MRTGIVVAGCTIGAISLLAATASARASIACSAGSVRATIGGKAACLRPGAHCRSSFQAQYRRQGFVCRNGRLERNRPQPSPAPPPPAYAEPGHYGGLGDALTFDVAADGRTIANLSVRLGVPCQPPDIRLIVPVTDPGSIAIESDGTFAVDYTDPSGLKPHLTVNGQIDLSGNASGTLELHVSTDLSKHYECDGTLPWTAMRQ